MDSFASKNGKFICGINIAEGLYTLDALNGNGVLVTETLKDGSWHSDKTNFGTEGCGICRFTNISISPNHRFEVLGEVVFRVTKQQ